MVVNSINFWIFFLAVLLPYFTILKGSVKWQNAWLLMASYFFYGWADWKMIPLLLIVTVVFYYLGLSIKQNNSEKPLKASRLTTLGVVLGIAVLFYFKYLGFFVHEFAHLFESFGLRTNLATFNIIMPIGISFFTFKLISYVIEVHRKNIEPTKNFLEFGTYIAFFPTILSGPIDRPGEFLPQLRKTRRFLYDNVSEGVRRVIWGMFMKICIADRISGYTCAVFDNYENHSPLTIITATLFYSFEMYTDFCGYSHMAIGVGQILGLKVRENFMRPFFAQNAAEFWRRWHMSLTTWITDYIFTPLNVAFRDLKKRGLYLATIINLVVIGVWHGANWTYAVFGLYHGLLLVFVASNEKKRKKIEKKYNLKGKWFYKYPRMILTFILVSVGLSIFRAPSMTEWYRISLQLFNNQSDFFFDLPTMAFCLPFLVVLFFKEYNDENKRGIHFLHSDIIAVRLITAILLICTIMLCGNLDGGQFIYFQF